MAPLERKPVETGLDITQLLSAWCGGDTAAFEQLAPILQRFFGGLSLEETAEVLEISVATVRKDWSLARAWLYRELTREKT